MQSQMGIRLLAGMMLLTGAGALGAQTVDKSATKPKEGRACLFTIQPESWTVLNNQLLVVWGPLRKDAYLMTLFSPLTGLGFADRLAFIDDDHNGMICGDGGDKLAVPDPHGISFPALISGLRRVDDTELLALSEQYKVKLLPDKKVQEMKQHDKQIHNN